MDEENMPEVLLISTTRMRLLKGEITEKEAGHIIRNAEHLMLLKNLEETWKKREL